MCDRAGHRQPMPVLHGGVAHIAKLGLPSGRLAIKPAVRVAGTRMSVVLALLAVEVGAIIIVAAAVPGRKLFKRSNSVVAWTYARWYGSRCGSLKRVLSRAALGGGCVSSPFELTGNPTPRARDRTSISASPNSASRSMRPV